ncbi:hypothetical protein [Luteitalea sp.]|jgi:hypothetical protein|uniref:hypothetical protein n=1 Tax=Luteitalea sp. TaxID=2004800 RepID=UPI0037C69724
MTLLWPALGAAALFASVSGVVDAEAAPVLVAGMSGAISPMRRGRGRPRKFDEPTRVVSLTLPEWVIGSLAKLHQDLGHAVAGLIQDRPAPVDRPPAELVTFGHRAVITVRPSRALERRLGIALVPLPDGRALIAFDTPQSVAELELRIHDALEDGGIDAEDRPTFEGIRAILRDARRSDDVLLVPRNIIVLEARPGARRKVAAESDAPE